MKTGKQVWGKTQRKFVEAPSQEKIGNELNASDVGHSSSDTTKVISNSDTVLDTIKEMQQAVVEEIVVT